MAQVQSSDAQSAQPERDQSQSDASTQTSSEPIESAKRRLLDPRTIAEQHSPGTWDVVEREAHDIAAALVVLPAQIRELSAQQDVLEIERGLVKAEEHDLAREALARSGTVVSRLYRLFGSDPILEQLREQQEEKRKESEAKSAALSALDAQLIETRRQLDALPEPDSGPAQLSQRMLRQPLSHDEKRELLRPEVLASLSLDEYIGVWRRIGPHFLAHVTRQGVRDHNAMVYHSAGTLEYHDGFDEILRNSRELRSPRMVHHQLNPTDRESIRRFLAATGVFDEPSIQDAKIRFRSVVHESIGSAPSYPDRGALHFAAQTVLDDYYGAESGNEIFFVYPSDFIASQFCFAFNGWHADFTARQSEDKWNDVFVWDGEKIHTSVPIDAGVVFLPRSTLVDPVTGSRYALTEVSDGQTSRYAPARYVEFDRAFKEWCREIPRDSSLSKVLMHMSSLGAARLASIESGDHEQARELYEQINNAEAPLSEAVKETLDGLNVPEHIREVIGSRLLNRAKTMARYSPERESVIAGEASFSIDEFYVSSILSYLRPATDLIPAQEYWESKFQQHPESRPRHVVYYDGTPADAVVKFLIDHEIFIGDRRDMCRRTPQVELSEEERLLGFSANHVSDMGSDPRANRGLEDLTTIGHELIDEWWSRTHHGDIRIVGNE